MNSRTPRPRGGVWEIVPVRVRSSRAPWLRAPRGSARKDARMEIPPPQELFARVGALPHADLLLERLSDEDPPVHLVGGAVRDVLLRRTPPELDLVVEGDVAPVVARLGGDVRIHDRFGTATVTVDDATFDLARARRERYARPGALPDVEPASLAEDQRRRDFTVNTGVIVLTGSERGQLIADERMADDLDARLLRVLHDASFIDDPTRLLRLARYVGRLGFVVEPHTRTLVGDAVDRHALTTVTGARIGAELRLLTREADPLAALRALHDLGLDAPLGLDGGELTRQRARGALALLPAEGHPDRLVLAAALTARARTDAPGAIRAQLDDWGYDAGDREVILAAATRAHEVAAALQDAGTPSEIAAAARHAPPELVALAGALGPADTARQWLEGCAMSGSRSPGRTCSPPGSRAARRSAGGCAGPSEKSSTPAWPDATTSSRQPCARCAAASSLTAMAPSLNALRWDGQPGHYEVYYLTVTEPQSGVGVWIRYTMVAPRSASDASAAASLWLLAMDPRPERPSTFGRKATVPVAEMHAATDPFDADDRRSAPGRRRHERRVRGRGLGPPLDGDRPRLRARAPGAATARGGEDRARAAARRPRDRRHDHTRRRTA